MKREPGVRKDGRCYLCPKRRVIPPKRLYRSHAERDAFCSRVCCERYFKTRRVDGVVA